MTFNGWLISKDPKIKQLGYIESEKKKGLFYKRCYRGMAFLDHRIDDDFPYKDQYEEGPRFYFKLEEPEWESIRVKRFQETLLEDNDIKFAYPIVDNYENLGEIGRPQDGFCNFCNKDFQDKGWFCSIECERNYKNQPNMLCEACQEPLMDMPATRHHISYFPEETAYVHQRCHMEIHRSDKYLHLRPPEEEKDRFYQKRKYSSTI